VGEPVAGRLVPAIHCHGENVTGCENTQCRKEFAAIYPQIILIPPNLHHRPGRAQPGNIRCGGRYGRGIEGGHMTRVLRRGWEVW
jgi:hypothetical protein